jgi:hypothetical protein
MDRDCQDKEIAMNYSVMLSVFILTILSILFDSSSN